MMQKLFLASLTGAALLGLAACSDSADNTTTQSTTPAPADQTETSATPSTTDTTTTQSTTPTPQTSTGGDMQGTAPAQTPAAPTTSQ